MKKLICLLLSLIYIISISKSANSKNINTNILSANNILFEDIESSNNQENNEDNELSNLENFKKFYLKIIENLSFRNTLWEQASNFMKISDKNEGAFLWASGIKEKNGTLLYAISNNNIKLQLKNLFKDNSSWLIENNQNIIESFEISKPKKISKNTFSYEITYKSMNIKGFQELLIQTISIEQNKKDYKVSEFSNITQKK